MTSPSRVDRRVLCVVGTRPEAVKVAPVAMSLNCTPGWEPLVLSTGQHGKLATEALDAFGLTPTDDLGAWTRGPDLAELHGELIGRVDAAVARTDPDFVLVQGDTASALVGALVAFWRHVPVVHLEAGLRTGSLSEPFPEEANRRMIAQIASLHLAPTDSAAASLQREGTPSDRVMVIGNTVVDAVRRLVERRHTDDVASSSEPDRPEAHSSLLLVTCHRRENWGEGVTRIARAIRTVVGDVPHLEVVVAAHPNPAVRAVLDEELAGVTGVVVRDAPDYATFIDLLHRARVAVTDSGGVQEEAAALGVPTLVLRELTERHEGVAAGYATLVGTDPERIVAGAHRVLSGPFRPFGTRLDCPYGDGRAAKRAVQAMRWLSGEADRPEPFVSPVTPTGTFEEVA